MVRDARIVRGVGGGAHRRRSRTPRQEAARRGRIEGFSGKSRARFLWHLRNVERLRYALTLTYSGPCPKDDRAAKAHVASFRRWVVGKGIGMAWKQEFTRHGRPHFHVVATAPLDLDAVRARWARIVGCEETPALVEARPIEDRTALEFYMVKRQNHYSNRVPEGYSNMGRWWGYGGPDSSPTPLATIEGPPSEVAPLVRALKAAQKAKRGKGRRRDNGATSMRLYDGGGETMAEDAARYSLALGLELSKPITGEEEKRSLTADGTAEDSE